MADRKTKIPAVPTLQASDEVLLRRASLEDVLISLPQILLPQVNYDYSNEEQTECQEPEPFLLHVSTTQSPSNLRSFATVKSSILRAPMSSPHPKAAHPLVTMGSGQN